MPIPSHDHHSVALVITFDHLIELLQCLIPLLMMPLPLSFQQAFQSSTFQPYRCHHLKGVQVHPSPEKNRLLTSIIHSTDSLISLKTATTAKIVLRIKFITKKTYMVMNTLQT